jgi:tRNA (guanine26-N2/guanine27-N2)-dimethyltransferase
MTTPIMAAECANGESSEQPEQSDASKRGSSQGQTVEVEGNRYTPIKEGLASILVPESQKIAGDDAKRGAPQNVFYNPIQQFNRDLSVLVIKTYGEDAITKKATKYSARINQAQRKELGAGHESKKRKRGHERPVAVESKIDRSDPINQDRLPEALEDSEFAQAIEDAKQVQNPTDSRTRSSNSKANGPQFSILDALSATGLRALRYAHEIPFVTRVLANDLSQDAAKSIRRNIVFNNLVGKIKAHQSNAMAHMYSFLDSKGGLKYDVIDLDPYGTACPFLDAAVQAITDGGLLCVTCTDAGVFASVGYPEKTYALYGGTPLKGPHCHEAGLRLILHAIGTSAARYGRSIEPLLSLSIDFYARVFVRVRSSPTEVKMLAGKTMIVYNCDQGCGAWTTQPLGRHRLMEGKKGGEYYKFGLNLAPQCSENCSHCGRKTHVRGLPASS